MVRWVVGSILHGGPIERRRPCSQIQGSQGTNSDSFLFISVVRVFAHGAMGRRVDPSWGGPIEL